MATETPEAPETAPAPTTKRRRLPLLIVGVLVLALAVWGIRRYLFSRHHVTTDNAQVDAHITLIAPRVAAFVSRVLVDDNQHVAAEDTLVVLDDRDLKVKLQQAEADLRAAQAAGGGRRTAPVRPRPSSRPRGPRQPRSRRQWSRRGGRLQQSRCRSAALSPAGSPEDRPGAAARRGRGGLPRRGRPTWRQPADRRRRPGARSPRRERPFGAPTRDWPRPRRRSTTPGFSSAMPTSPRRSSGTIARRNAESGALVQIGQTLMSIVPDSDVWVTANLKETQMTHVRVGDRAEFTVDAYPGHEFEGRVASLSPATGARFALLPPDNATGNFTKVVQRIPVKIAVDQPAETATPLRPGMSVEVTITTGEDRQTMPLPGALRISCHG